MSRPKIAKATVCDSQECLPADLLVRGTHIEFVSVEQVRAVGRHKLDYYKMPSDIRVPAEFVLVQDTTGSVLRRCDFYVVRARSSASRVLAVNHEQVLRDAREYFGNDTRMSSAKVDIPKGPWHRLGKVQFIRYRRWGNAKGFYEHEYEPSVDLFGTRSPSALRLALPDGCVVDSRGFGKP